jgi:glutaconyl-CoA decarboxylase
MTALILPSLPPVFGVLSRHPNFGESFAYQLTGLMVVFTALGLIWLSLTLLGIYFKRMVPAKIEPAPVADAIPVGVPADGLSPELVAVIAAAVQMSLQGSYRIQAIVPVRGQDWAHEGRRQIFASHQVR